MIYYLLDDIKIDYFSEVRGEGMQVKCSLCDKVEEIEDHCLQAKRLRNRRIYMYLCNHCYDRIEVKTNERLSTGDFKLYRENKKEDQYI